ncbi:MAG: 50S ribosomal protein L13 [Microgenomates group bacterium]
MVSLTRSTKSKSATNIKREWYLIDVEGKIFGRIVPEIAKLLQGKHKVDYVPYLDCGDYVVVINASKVKVTGKKYATKKYTYYSGYPGGLKEINFQTLLKKNPSEVIKRAVSGMLPKNKLRDQRLKRLFVFAEEKHPYGDKIRNYKS